MHLALQTEHLEATAAAWLGERCKLVRCAADEPGFYELLAQADALVIRTYTRVDAALLARAPRLKVVGRAGVGLDNVDLAACAARGVVVVNTPEANTSAVVEYVLALMLDATRPRGGLDKAVDARRWKELREELKAPRQLRELTLGIWGLGKIGREVARVAAALGMRVVYYDIMEIPEQHRHGALALDREQLCAQADVLTVHVDGRASNCNLVGPADFALMKPGVVFINAARGFVVDRMALAGFLRANAGALGMLDVHEPEPFDASYPLLGVPNAHLYPHLASATALAHTNMSWVVKDVWRVLNGEEPMHRGVAEA